jgi:pilus assembly protein CpaB
MTMLGAATVCAGLAVSAVDRYAADVDARVGPLVPVLIATRDIPEGRVVTPFLAARGFAERQVPERFAPPAALRSRTQAVGREVSGGLRAGDYVGALQLRRARPARSAQARWTGDTRLVEVSVAGVRSIAAALRPGALVDVLITSERGAPRTFLALQRMPVAGFEPGGTGSLGDGDAPDGRVTLRTTLRQAVLLTAADNFAREVRVVPRAPGDERRYGTVAIAAGRLGR